MPDTSTYFIDLLRLVLCDRGGRESGLPQSAEALAFPPLSAVQWKEICRLAQKQSVLGLIARAIAALPAELAPPLGIRARINYYSEQIAGNNTRLNARAAEITGIFAQMGFRTCVLKGQGTAALYADPTSRQSGDIDLWVYACSAPATSGTSAHACTGASLSTGPSGTARTEQCSRARILRAIESRWSHGPCFYHHTGIRPFTDGTEVEVHFTPTWMNDYFANRRLQRYFCCIASELAATSDPASAFELASAPSGPAATSGFRIPPAEFNLVFNAVHIYRHLLADGVGLRQIIDYWHILRAADAEDLRQAFIVLKSLKMKRFVGALMYVEQQLFSLEDEHLLCPPAAGYGSFLVNEIFLAGNFGRSDTRFEYDTYGSILSRAFSRMSRLWHFFRYAPSEVLWAPAFKVWQRLRFL